VPSIAVQERSQLQRRAQRERRLFGVTCVTDRPQHAHAPGAGVKHVENVLVVDATDREERDAGVGGGIAHQLGTYSRATGLCRCGVYRTDADVVDERGSVCGLGHGEIDLGGGVCRESDEHLRTDDPACLGHGRVLLADVHAVGAYRGGDIGAIVEDEQRAVGIADIGGDACGFGEELVLEMLLAQLHHIDATGYRLSEELAQVAISRHAVAYQVETRGDKARAALLAIGVGHGPQVGHRGQSDTCGRSSISPMSASNGSTVDLAVLGGGIVGLSVAWRARMRGMSVVLLERDELGSGATHVAAGMLAPVAEVEFGEAGGELLKLGMRSAAMWPSFAEELERASGICVELRRGGTLVVARDEDEARELERQLAFRESLGLRATRLRASEARAREPALAPTVRLALHAPDDHSVDPRLVVAALRRACERTGVELREHSGCCGLELDASATRVIGVAVSRGGRDGAQSQDVVAVGGASVGAFEEEGSCEVVSAREVVVAAGAWSAGVAGLPDGAGVPVRPVKGQIMRLRDPAGPGLLEGVLRFGGGYLVPRGDGGYVLGATMEERGFEPHTTAGGIYELLRDAHELVPGVSELHIEELGVGYRPGTPDNLPVIGPGALEGLTWATGHHRNGILLAPLTAELAMASLSGENVHHEPVTAR
jgi:glycine oxidase